MNLTTPRLLLVLLLGCGLLFGCASSKSGNVYSAGSARTAQTVEFGVVQNVRQVVIEGSNSGVGAAGGAVIGGIAGSHVGKGSGQTVGAVVGGILGGLAGSAAERAATKRDGLEITVKLDSGRMIAIVQEADQAFRIGDKVQVLSGGGEARVTPR